MADVSLRGHIHALKQTDRGVYGFLRVGDLDYFFLPSSLQNGASWSALYEGQVVEFQVVDHPKGLRARDGSVRVLP